MVGVLLRTGGERSMAGLRACNTACATPLKQGGSATELSATDAWHGAAVDDEAYVRLIRTVARSSFTQKARNLDSTKGVSIQKEPAGSCKFLKMVKTASCRVDGYNKPGSD
jgi:hypothetical protein